MTAEDWIGFVLLSLVVVLCAIDAEQNQYRNNRPVIVVIVSIVLIAAVFFMFRYGWI